MPLRPHHLLPRMDRHHRNTQGNPARRNQPLPILPPKPPRPTLERPSRHSQGIPRRSRTSDPQRIHTMTSPRSTAAYRSWVKQVLAKCEPTCIRCGYPVDMDLPRTHPQGASADHEPPLAETGDLTPGMDGSGIAHLQCNRSHGGRLGSARAQANQNKQTKQTKKQTQTRPNDSLDTTITTPAAPICM